MRKFLSLWLLCAVLFTSCTPVFSADDSAAEKLYAVLAEFSLTEGAVYSTEENEDYPFTDAMAERMFFWGRDISALSHAQSTAVYVSRRFSSEEIVVVKLRDRSYRDEVEALFLIRAEKKKNAIVFCDGVYVYLICAENRDEIKRFLTK